MAVLFTYHSIAWYRRCPALAIPLKFTVCSTFRLTTESCRCLAGNRRSIGHSTNPHQPWSVSDRTKLSKSQLKGAHGSYDLQCPATSVDCQGTYFGSFSALSLLAAAICLDLSLKTLRIILALVVLRLGNRQIEIGVGIYEARERGAGGSKRNDRPALKSLNGTSYCVGSRVLAG